ncbi:MAG: glycosyltransferase family 8 protein [Oscillospiraceae bacterium]|nr:glycosyltransferase family 8 protein [Oscillospiraceae bacterium]
MRLAREKFKTIVITALMTVFFVVVAVLSYKYREKIYFTFKNFFRGDIVWSEPDVEKNLTDGVPIVVTTDDGYAHQTLVALRSLFKAAGADTFYKVNVLVTNEFKEESKKEILSSLDGYKDKGEIEFINMRGCFENGYISKHFSKVVYYRLRIPSVLKTREKCIYVDTDTIINSDLKELYEINLEGNWIAGVPDSKQAVKDENEEKNREKYGKNIGLSDFTHYINSGVLLWDLKAIRENDVEEKFHEFLKTHHNPEQHDQTTINVTCYSHILLLPFKYNNQIYMFSNKPYGQDHKKCSLIFSESQWNEGWKNPVIIHYAGDEKPWKGPVPYNVEKWWSVARETDYYDSIVTKYMFPNEKH